KKVPDLSEDVGLEEDDPEPTEDQVEIGESKTVIVQINDMTTQQRYIDFLELVAARPGNNRVQVSLNGGIVNVEGTTGLSPRDQQEISMIFNGARVYYKADKVNKNDLLKAVGL